MNPLHNFTSISQAQVEILCYDFIICERSRKEGHWLLKIIKTSQANNQCIFQPKIFVAHDL